LRRHHRPTAVAFYRDREIKGDDIVSQQLAFGWSLYARALAEPDDPGGADARRASLEEAAQVMASLSDEAKQLHDERVLIAWIGAELARSGGKADGTMNTLTCYEAEPCQCHRHCVAEALEREFGTKFAPRHL